MISKKDELQQFVSKIEIEGRNKTDNGNYTVFFNEFEDVEYEFLVQNKEAILELLKSLECVDSEHTWKICCTTETIAKYTKMNFLVSSLCFVLIIVQMSQKKIFN